MENQHRISYQPSIDNMVQMDIGDDPYSLSALLSLDNYPELYSPYGYSTSPFNFSDISTLECITQSQNKNNFDETVTTYSASVPKSMPCISLAEKMLRALSYFKETSGTGILAQVWMPVNNGNGYVLSTCEQPFLLDQILAGYREISRGFTFSAEETPGSFPGLPGRVFISGLPEWTSNVVYYSKCEYLRADYANSHEVRGSLAVPIFDPKEKSCCAVLELVTTKEKPDFNLEMESVCNALQAVDLKTAKVQACQQNLTDNQKSAFSEILDVLRACCHAHTLPLALTWAPCSSDSNSDFKNKSLRIQESACYVLDPKMKGFLHACTEHQLEKGQAIAGKALKSNHPFFSPDVKGYNIREYPLAHHARKYNLNAAVAIRLRSTFTGNDDYILEFFLPISCRGSLEQQDLLNSLSITMQRICKSLRTVSEAEAVSTNSMKSVVTNSDNETMTNFPFEDSRATSSGAKFKPRQHDKKRSTAEKNISLSVLQQYFSGSLKNAAKSIGVCPTTLKRICRQHGITRWPSRKIKKVNRSLEKLQTVINSVQGVDGALKYDPTTGCIVASVSAEKSTTTTLDTANQDDTLRPQFSTPDIETEEIFQQKMDFDDNSLGISSIMNLGSIETNDNLLKRECSHPSSSSMTDSSSGSASSFSTFTKSSKEKSLMSDVDNGHNITVKATYKGDTVRFKFERSMGCHELFEQIGKRYKLSMGTFQVKYMDDEYEWVMLSNDSDWFECIDVLESSGSKNLKLQVRDTVCSFGSSGGSNNYLQA